MKALGLVVLGVLVVACSAPGGTVSPSASIIPAGPRPSVTGMVTAGPVCPVERNPPDPSCAPRMMAAAVIVATDASGQEVARATTAADGSYLLTIGETGTFTDHRPAGARSDRRAGRGDRDAGLPGRY